MIDVIIGSLATLSLLCHMMGMDDIAALIAYSGGIFVISISMVEAMNG